MKTSTRHLLVVGFIGAVIAATADSMIYGLGRTAGLEFVIARTSRGPQPIRPPDVVVLSLSSFALGLTAALVATRLRRQNMRAFQVVGAVLALVSTSMDFTINSTLAAKATLALMHLVVGTAYVVSLQVLRSPRPVTPASHPEGAFDGARSTSPQYGGAGSGLKTAPLVAHGQVRLP